MIDVLRIAHLRIAPQEGNLEVGNCEGNRLGGSVDSRLGVEGGESWSRMVLCFSSKCRQLECSLGVDLDSRLDKPMAGGKPTKLEALARGEEEE